MKQIVDKLNKIAKAIDETVEVPTTDLITDSLDAITKAFGGTPNDSNLIVDKLEDIAGVAHSGITPTGTINITDTALTDVAQYRNAQVSSETLIADNIKKDVDILGVTGTFEGGGGGTDIRKCTVTVENTSINNGHANVLYFDENGCLDYREITIPANGSATLNYLVMYDPLLQSFVPANFPNPSFWDSFNNVDFDGDPPAFTDLINITVNESMQPLLTSPTTDASFTVRVGFTPIA